MAGNCWIDGTKCYDTSDKLTLDHCALCQKSRLTKSAIAKAETVVVEVAAPNE